MIFLRKKTAITMYGTIQQNETVGVWKKHSRNQYMQVKWKNTYISFRHG